MVKRTKKPPVPPEKAREWLRRLEDRGESVPQIAKTDYYDVRTVRKQVEKAREERDRRQSRQMVLREALEMHYADLCSLAEKIRADLIRNTPSSLSLSLRDDPLYEALKKHVPKLRAWKNIERLGTMEVEFREVATNLRQRIAAEAGESLSLPVGVEPGKWGLDEDFVKAMLSHLVNKASGGQGLDDQAYKAVPTDSGIRLERGVFLIALAPKVRVKKIQTTFDRMMVEALAWEEYLHMSGIVSEFYQILSKVKDELTKIILTRVVPGRCDYCPI